MSGDLALRPAGQKPQIAQTRAAARSEIRARRIAAGEKSYGSIRENFQEGDLLLFRGKGVVSMAIRALTGSTYSHAGLVYLFHDRVYVIEAVGAGVRLLLMSELMKRYDGGIDYYEVVRATPKQRRHAIAFCFEQLGKLYDKVGILRFLLLLLFRRKLAAAEDQAWFCSELAAAAYRKQDLPLAPEMAEYTSPNDLALSPEVRLRYTLKPA
jgi:uncharacterized protein YycO